MSVLLSLNSAQDAVRWLRERVTGTLQTDSRLVKPGDGFIAWPVLPPMAVFTSAMR